MITFARCKEIFADNKYFENIEFSESEIKPCRVNMRKLSKTGERYRFGFRRMPNGCNDVAEVFFAKWTPMRSFLVCQNICDEGFLLALIRQCHEVGNF